jgi:hypothetical protein
MSRLLVAPVELFLAEVGRFFIILGRAFFWTPRPRQKGYFTRGGAEGVGRATTQAVVLASIAILITDFFLTKLLV